MAGLQSIPRDLYEAAAVDGAGNLRQLRTSRCRSLRPVNLVLVLVLFLWTFNDFNTPYVLFGRRSRRPADLISFHIYNASFLTWNFGIGSAMSVLLLLFLLVVTAAYLLVTADGGAPCVRPSGFQVSAGRADPARRCSPSSRST